MSLILLKNDRHCPRCLKPRIDRDLRKCMACNMALLWPGDDGAFLTKQGILSYYLWTRNSGWVHSDHLSILALSDPQPNQPLPKCIMPDKSYGTQALPEGCSAD